MREFSRSESGSIAPIFALSLAAIIGVIATTIALASDSRAANEIQYTADSAAIAGATAFATLETPKADERLQQALQAAEDYAVANSSYTLVEIDLDAVTEDAYGQTTSIDVELEFQPANVMARVAGRSGNVAVRRRASAQAVWGFPLCALSLSENETGFDMTDSSRFDATNCIAWSNSTSHVSMSFRGSHSKARGFCAAGGVIGSHHATPTPEQHCDPIPDPLADWSPPLPGSCVELDASDELGPAVDQGLQISLLNVLSNTLDVLAKGDVPSGTVYPTYDTSTIKDALQNKAAMPKALVSQIALTLEAADAAGDLIDIGGGNDTLTADGVYKGSNAEGLTPIEAAVYIGIIEEVDPAEYADEPYVNTPSLTLTPGTYCGLDIKEGHVKFEPGIYFIKEAPLTVRRKATLTGEGVTIVLSGEDASFNIIDEARLTLSGPETGETAGFALVEDKKAAIDNDARPQSRLAGDGVVDAIGTIYLPRHDFLISGNGSGQQASPLLQVVANTVTLSDNGHLSIDFDPNQTQVPVGIKPARTARLVH